MGRGKRALLGGYIRPIYLAVDCLIFNLLFWVTTLIFPHWLEDVEWIVWIGVNISLVPVLIYATRIKLHHDRLILLDHVFSHSLSAIGIHALFLLAFDALFKLDIPLRIIAAYYGMLVVVLPLWSLVSRWLIKSYRRRGYNYVRVVIVGTNPTSKRLYEEMMADPGYGYRMLAFFDPQATGEFCGKPSLDMAELERFVPDNNVDQIYYAISGDDESLPKVVKIAEDNVAEFFYVPKISRYVARNFHNEHIGAVPVLSIQNNPLKRGVNRLVKRSFDIGFSLAVLAFYYPFIYLPVSIAIKSSSPGPVYFKQSRTGYKGKPFECYKFRSMTVNKQADTVQATKDDARTTAVGKFLRSSSLDEFPQFINVLKGDMSVVGPRPHMLKHTEEYSQLVDRYMMRHMVKPGITGWAQVNGYRGQTDELWKMEKRVENDMWYIEHWSFLLDLKIIVRTFMNVFKHEENAF